MALAVLAVTMLASAEPGAIERRPLPSFGVAGTDSQPVASSTLVSSGKWLLVYVMPRCQSCDRLLGSIDLQQQPTLPSRMAILVGGVDAAGAAAMGARFPQLAGARWYADRERSSVAALNLTGAPIVIGLRNEVIEWSMAGLVPDLDGVKSALISWAGIR